MELIWMSEKPLEYSFDEIELGMQKSFKVFISENMLDVFGRDTGDYNPLHTVSYTHLTLPTKA